MTSSSRSLKGLGGMYKQQKIIGFGNSRHTDTAFTCVGLETKVTGMQSLIVIMTPPPRVGRSLRKIV